MNRAQEKQREKAIAAQTAEAEAQYQDRIITRTLGDNAGRSFDVTTTTGTGRGEPTAFTETGLKGPKAFLGTRGADASTQRAAALEAIDKDREEIAKGLTTPEAQQMFRMRTHAMREGTRRDIEAHTLKENQAAFASSVKTSQDASLRALAADPMGPNVQQQIAQPEGPTSALALPGEGDAAVANWRGLAATTRLKTLIKRGDHQNAQAVYEEAKGLLPKDYADDVEKDIGRVRVNAQGHELGRAAVERSVQPNGTVDVDKAVEEVLRATAGQVGKDGEPMPADEDMRKVAINSALQGARLKNQQEKAKTEQVRRAAGAQFNTGGWSSIPQDVKDELNKRDDAYWRRLRDYELNQYQRRLAARRAGAGSEDREQERINRDALRAYNSHTPEERSKMDVETEFAATGVNKSGFDLIKGHQVTDVERLKTHGERETAFVNEVLTDAKGKRQVNGKASDTNTAVLRSLATEKFQAWVTENKGALPSTKDTETMRNEVLRIQQVPGLVYGTNPKPQWKIDAEAKANGQGPAPKKVRSYRYSKDRTSRKPVFEDGSEGPPEQVK